MPRTLLFALLAVVLLPFPAATGDPARTTAYEVAALFAATGEPAREALGLPPSSSPLAWDPARADEEDAEPVLFLDPELLVELVVTAAARVLEGDEDASVEMIGDRLVVSGGPALHAAAQEVLGLLWREASRRLRLQATRIRFEPEARAELQSAGLLEALRSGRPGEAQREALLRLGGRGASSVSAQVASGRRAVLGRVDSTSYVRDYDVEIAQDSRVGNPIVDTVNEGWLLDVRAFAMQGEAVFVEVLGQAAVRDHPIRRLPLEAEPFGSLELPACRVWRFATAARIGAGETLAFHAVSEGGYVDVLLLHAEVRGARLRPGGIRRYDVGALTATPFPWRLERDADARPETGALRPPAFRRLEGAEPLIEGDELVDELSLQFGEGAWEREGTWLLASDRALLASNEPPLLDAIGEIVRAKEAVLETHRLTLRLIRSEADAKSVLTEASLDVPGNRAVAWQVGEERAYVADWDVEVAQEARAGDPQPSTVFGGLTLNLELDPAPMAGAAVLAIEAAWTEVDRRIDVRRDENDCTGVVEVPRLTRQQVTQDLIVHTGEPTRLVVSRLPDGADLLLEVRLAR